VTVQIEYHAQLVMTRWNQGTGYNNLAPNFICTGSGAPSNGRAWAGCVATAIGQIAAYHQHPSSYNWASMPNLTGSAETSRLLRDIGDAVEMDWGCDGSGTNGGTKTVLGFNMLGYTMSKRKFEAFTSTDPTDYFMTEIRNNRPFLISGGRQGNFLIFNYYKNGHEWVCDGFDRYKYSYTEVIQVDFDTWIYNDVVTYPTYFHMNWGWGGQHDGWFRIGEFAPTVENYRDTYRDDFPGTYNYKNSMYYNINPI